MNLTKKILLPILFLACGIGVFAYLKMTRAEQPTTQVQERVWRVAVLEARPETLAPTLTLYGRVESPNVLKAAAPAEAVVQQVLVKEGEQVHEGQLLLQLDQRDFLPRLDQSKAEVAQLEADIAGERQRHQRDEQALKQEQEILRLAQAAVTRAEQLKKQSMGSESALDEARQNAARQALVVISREFDLTNHQTRLDQLQARLLQARAKLQETELELERSRVSAPFDGVVSDVAVAPGDRVRKADVMLQMYDPQTLEVRARIPAPYRDELQQSLSQGLQMTGRTLIGAAEILLSLERLSGEADPRGIDGLFRIDQGLRWLRLGETLQFQLRRPPRDNALALPYQALYGGNRVYLLEDGRMRGIQVKALGSLIDEERGEQLVVSSVDLPPGAQVVTTHLPNAVTGLRAEAVD
jgi:multidrug efflux pump subunit AcrA (membrane-fusion protein)